MIAAATTNFTFNNVNQMLTSQVGSGTIKNYVHDNNGNLTNDGARSYEWDDVNRLTAIIEGTKRFEFTYDGLGRRVKMRDHLGSVREVMKNASSTVEAKYDYDPCESDKPKSPFEIEGRIIQRTPPTILRKPLSCRENPENQ